MSRILPNLGLQAFFAFGEDGWNDEMDNNILRLSVLVQAGAINKVVSLPASPSEGDVYILNENAASNANSVVIRDDNQWKYVTPSEGWLIYNRTDDRYESFNGSQWVVLATGSSGGGGGGGLLPFAGARASRSSVTNLSTTGVWTPIQWNVIDRNSLSLWSNANPSRFTVPEGVTKIRLMSALQVNNADTAGNNQFTFRKNGTEFFNGRSVWGFDTGGYNNPGAFGLSDIIDVVEGDYFEVVYFIAESLSINSQSFFSIEVIERTSSNVAIGVTVDELLDVNVPEPEHGEAIIYDENIEQWVSGRPLVTANTIQGMNKPFKGAMAKFTANRLVSVSPTVVAWDGTDFDTDGFWSAANPTRLSIPIDSGITKVRLTATLMPTSTDMGSDHLYCVFRKNGSSNFRGNGAMGYEIGYTDVGVSLSSGIIPVVEGDFFEVFFNSPDTERTWSEATSHFSIEVVEVNDPWTVDASYISPLIKDSNIITGNSNSFVIPIPSLTEVGDYVLIFCASGWNINSLSGWTTVTNTSGTTQTMGRVFVKRMVQSDLTAGSVTVTTSGSFNAVFSAVTVEGKTLDSISAAVPFQASTNTASLELSMPFSSPSDRVLYFAANRAASNNTFTSGALLQTVNATNFSGSLAQSVATDSISSNTVNFSTSAAYYCAAVNLKSRRLNPDFVRNSYNIPFGFTSRPSSNEVMLLHVFGERVSFKRNWLGSLASIGTNSTGTIIFDVRKNNSSVGSITIAPSGVVSFSSSQPQEFMVGDVLSIVAPSTLDASVANGVFSLRGTKVANDDSALLSQINPTGSRVLFSWNGATDAPFSISAPISLGNTRMLQVHFSDVTLTGNGWRVCEFSFDGGITWEGNLGVNNYLASAPTNGLVGAAGTGNDQSWFIHATSSSAARSCFGQMWGLGAVGIKNYQTNRNPAGIHLNRNAPTHIRVRGWLSETTQTDFTGGRITIVGYL